MALAALLLVACGSSAAPVQTSVSSRGLPLADATFHRGTSTLLHLTVEVAATQAAQEKGLMGIRHLAADQGMAFTFATAGDVAFWMKDTLIPLDIAFVDAAGRVVDVQRMVPCTADPCTIYHAAGPFTVAVETGAGVLTGAGVHAGDTMRLTRRGRTG